MNIFENRKTRIIVLTAFITVMGLFAENSAFGTLITFVQASAALVLLWTVYTIIRDRYRKNEEIIDGFIARIFIKIFGPAVRRIFRASDRQTKYIIGSDTLEYSGFFSRLGIKRTKRKKKEKVSVKDAGDVRKAVRLTYVTYILKALEKGRDVTVVQTPSEIKDMLSHDGGGELFDVYEKARYSVKEEVSRSELDSCKRISSDY